MFPLLMPIFRWADGSWLSREIRASTWQFAILEMVHLLGLTVLLGALMVLDLRLFGYGMRKQPVSQLAKDLAVWTRVGLVTILGSGVFLFFGEPMKLSGSPSFHVKMLLLFLAIVFQFTLFRKVTLDDGASPRLDKVAGVLSLALWFGVGLAGRAIGFL
jgi:uncharacterized membrane protein